MQNTLAGLVLLAFGATFAAAAWIGVDIGTAFRMGPGYLPLVLGLLLVVLGAVIVATPAPQDDAPARVNWRALILLTLATLYFALTIRNFGALPAVFGSVLLAALADRAKLWQAALIGAVLAAATIGIFVYGLGLPIPVLGMPRWF